MATPIRASPTSRGVDIDSWNRATPLPLRTSLISASLADSPLRDATLPLEIALDQETQRSITQQRREAKALKAKIVSEQTEDITDDGRQPTSYVRGNGGELRRRDSLKRREALLKGKEGSRRRQKWENDRLLGNPAFQPPEPHDWAPHPTHTVQHVPYLLAPLWDERYAAAARQRSEQSRQAAAGATPQVPRDLKEKLKRAKGARTLLQQLEEQVRSFMREWEEKQTLRADGWDVDVSGDGTDDDDEHSETEVVFLGRKHQGRPRPRPDADAARNEKLIFDSLVNDQDGSFSRWLVHSIASYYKLHTWSVTKGNPARREAYVSIPETWRPRSADGSATGGCASAMRLPQPLWVMV